MDPVVLYFPYALIRRCEEVTFLNYKQTIYPKINGDNSPAFNTLTSYCEKYSVPELFPKNNSWNFALENAVRIDDIEPWWITINERIAPVAKKSKGRAQFSQCDTDFKKIFEKINPIDGECLPPAWMKYSFVNLDPCCPPMVRVYRKLQNIPVVCDYFSVDKLAENDYKSQKMVNALCRSKRFKELVSELWDSTDKANRMPYTKTFGENPEQ